MRTDVARLKAFYETPLGEMTARQIARRVAEFWPNLKGDTVVGLGYAAPVLDAIAAEADPGRTLALMPATQGAWPWPADGGGRTALTEEARLPLPDRSADRIVLLHAIEEAPAIEPLLREVWRVLADDGRVIAIAANRRGLWAQVESKPFGHGRPYSAAQLRRLLARAMLTVEQETHALYAPPSRRSMGFWPAEAAERFGRRWLSRFGGVVIADASKNLYGAAPTAAGARAARAGELVGAPVEQREARRDAGRD